MENKLYAFLENFTRDYFKSLNFRESAVTIQKVRFPLFSSADGNAHVITGNSDVSSDYAPLLFAFTPKYVAQVELNSRGKMMIFQPRSVREYLTLLDSRLPPIGAELYFINARTGGRIEGISNLSMLVEYGVQSK